MLAQQTVVHHSCKWEWNFKATPKAKNMHQWLSLCMSLLSGFIRNTQLKITFEEINILWLLILGRKSLTWLLISKLSFFTFFNILLSHPETLYIFTSYRLLPASSMFYYFHIRLKIITSLFLKIY